ncbi:hypothetical protein EB796_015622 [Bugula neritina]|uniref:Uncharacterized protein n=1 Tax=Bugula neritina TaxID=10212 RepID=A0A7J7JKF8_BUGNE|nr:hypothetical protein EB796_015622 [Bugula neritina]
MPLQKSISPYKGTPVLAEFNTEEFIQSLDSSLITCEVKDQLIRMHDKQMCLKETQGVHSKYRTGLAKHIENIISTLPPDLSSVLVNLRPSEAGS